MRARRAQGEYSSRGGGANNRLEDTSESGSRIFVCGARENAVFNRVFYSIINAMWTEFRVVFTFPLRNVVENAVVGSSPAPKTIDGDLSNPGSVVPIKDGGKVGWGRGSRIHS